MTTLPAFPLGFPLNVGYMGLYRADERATDRGGRPVSLGYSIHGYRLVPSGNPDRGPDGLGRSVYHAGWECLIARVEGDFADETARLEEYGWVSEAELLMKGYGRPRCIHGERFPCCQCSANRQWNDSATRRKSSDQEFVAAYVLEGSMADLRETAAA